MSPSSSSSSSWWRSVSKTTKVSFNELSVVKPPSDTVSTQLRTDEEKQLWPLVLKVGATSNQFEHFWTVNKDWDWLYTAGPGMALRFLLLDIIVDNEGKSSSGTVWNLILTESKIQKLAPELWDLDGPGLQWSRSVSRDWKSVCE